MNQITHWLDASNIYGSDDRVSDILRSKSGGKLKVSNQNGQDMLPLCREYDELYELEACHQPCGNDCFAAG